MPFSDSGVRVQT
uniref:Uncharacterized protein n=1 Tax=Arundo donax TaxID=35708 RepID=A0A0A9GSI2_ARUDO